MFDWVRSRSAEEYKYYAKILNTECREPPIQPPSSVNSFSDKVSSAYSTFQALLGYQTASSDPISEETICLQSSQELGRFHPALKNTAQRVKNLAIIGMFNRKESEIDTILAMCNGVENLLVSAAVYNLGFFTNPQAGQKLRRLTIQLRKFRPPSGSKPTFLGGPVREIEAIGDQRVKG